MRQAFEDILAKVGLFFLGLSLSICIVLLCLVVYNIMTTGGMAGFLLGMAGIFAGLGVALIMMVEIGLKR